MLWCWLFYPLVLSLCVSSASDNVEHKVEAIMEPFRSPAGTHLATDLTCKRCETLSEEQMVQGYY